MTADPLILLKDLLAVIHGDYGDHTNKVGIEQSCKDAEGKISRLQDIKNRSTIRELDIEQAGVTPAHLLKWAEGHGYYQENPLEDHLDNTWLVNHSQELCVYSPQMNPRELEESVAHIADVTGKSEFEVLEELSRIQL